MTKIKQMSLTHYLSDDETTEIYVRSSGRAVNHRSFSGSWQFSPKHGDMMPHKETFSIVVNGDYRVRDLFEEDIADGLRRLGFEVVR